MQVTSLVSHTQNMLDTDYIYLKGKKKKKKRVAGICILFIGEWLNRVSSLYGIKT